MEGGRAGSPLTPLGFSMGATAELHPHQPRPGRLRGRRRAAPASSHEPGSAGLSGSARARQWVATGGAAHRRTLGQLLDQLEAEVDERGLDALTPGARHGGLARPRRSEIGAALNRLRSLQMEQRPPA